MRVAGALPLLTLGFAAVAIAGIAPVLTVMAILVHANLDWDWAHYARLWPRRGATAGTHTDAANARDKNFAGLSPIWDILFGTYYMPRDRRPRQFETASAGPAGLTGQMLFPFWRG